MAPDEDNKKEKEVEEDKRFTLPTWVNNMSKSWKTIVVLIGALTFTLGIASQVLSLGFDYKIQMQQIKKNEVEITNLKCINTKKELEKDLKADKRALRSIKIDYLAKGLEIPDLLREDYINLPIDIDGVEKKLEKLPCYIE